MVSVQPLRRTGLEKGFTLLEVLIALALLAILCAALYGTFFSLTRGRDSATAAMAEQRELRDTVDKLQRELSAAFYKKEPDESKQRLHFVVEDRDFFGKPASTLNFTTISPPVSGSQRVSDQTEVRYIPVEKDGNKIVLARQVKDVYMEGDTPRYPQMEQIEGFLVECTADGTKWVRTWDAADQGLPKAVRVTIKVREGDKTVDFTILASPRVR